MPSTSRRHRVECLLCRGMGVIGDAGWHEAYRLKTVAGLHGGMDKIAHSHSTQAVIPVQTLARAADLAEPTALRRGVAGGNTRWRLAVLLILLASALATWQMHRLIEAHQQARLDYEAQRIESAVAQRMTAYVQVLRGGLGLFVVTDSVRLGDWLRYVDALQLTARYPGFKSLSFAEAVTTAQMPAFLARMQSQPLPPELHKPELLRDYTLRAPAGSSGDPALHSPIVFVAPLIPENERVLGVDMMREPTRRAAMELAASTNAAVLSPRLQLSGQGNHKAGFIAYLPVRRDDHLLGWLTAAFLADNFMAGLLGSGTTALDFEVYDGPTVRPEALLYSTAGIADDGTPLPLPLGQGAAPEQQRQIELPGRHWTLRYRAGAGFIPLTDRLAPWLVLLGGLLAALLLHVTARGNGLLRLALDRVAEKNQRLHSEIREREQAEAEARHQATHDPLTGLANRSLFMDRLGTALERAHRRNESFALAYIDIDGFKAVNDQHGHAAGDELLRTIAQRFATTLRKEDTLARLGGDEFAVVFEQVQDDPALAAGRLCLAIIESLMQPIVLAEGRAEISVRVGASVGLAVYPQNGSDRDTLIHAADSAMYCAKRGGKNRCITAT